MVTGAGFWRTTSRGFTQTQLASTASYQAKDLQGIDLMDNDLTGWDFSGQDLTGASFTKSTLTNANLSGTLVTDAHFGGANLKNAYLGDVQDISSSSFYDNSTGFSFYNQWTLFPSDFDPVATGLTLVMSPVGDLDADDAWDADDVDMLASKIAGAAGLTRIGCRTRCLT